MIVKEKRQGLIRPEHKLFTALMAMTAGLEPATSSVTGWRSNQAELRHHIFEYIN